jgi:hypothetical protein
MSFLERAERIDELADELGAMTDFELEILMTSLALRGRLERVIDVLGRPDMDGDYEPDPGEASDAQPEA